MGNELITKDNNTLVETGNFVINNYKEEFLNYIDVSDLTEQSYASGIKQFGYYLNENKIVISPDRWFNDYKHNGCTYLLSDNFIKVPSGI